MKKQILGLLLVSAVALSSCGGEEEKKEDLPTFCECVTAKGAPPAGCDKVVDEDMSEEEFDEKYRKCKD